MTRPSWGKAMVDARDDARRRGVDTSMISRLIPRYAEPHRRYHTWSHIGACFEACEMISDDRSREVALALLYHDAIYEPLRPDNEERSAALLLSEGTRAGEDLAMLGRTADLVLATKHGGTPDSDWACIVVDADLSILGTEDAVFDAYERAIREEYSMVPDEDFRVGRRKILAGFLERKSIFSTSAARRLWEESARKNLARSIAKLDARKDSRA